MTSPIPSILRRWLPRVPTEDHLERMALQLYADHSHGNWLDDFKVAVIWGIAAGLCAAALFPHLMQVTPDRFESELVPPAVQAVSQGMQAALLMGLTAFAGLRMGYRVRLGSPLVQQLINRRPYRAWRMQWLWQSLLFGVLAGAGAVTTSALFDVWAPASAGASVAAPTPFNAFWVSMYDGVAGEIQLRLFLMTLLVWLYARPQKAMPSSWVYVAAIVVAGIFPSLSYASIPHAVLQLEPTAVARFVTLNAIGGVVFGWMYWKRGFEMAVTTHFSTALVLHIIGPLVQIAVA